LVLTAGAAWGQAGPGQAAALCEGLQDATPGLYGLCLAFHNVEPCMPDLLAQDPFAGCEPKDGRLLAQYDALKGPDDPRLPGTGGPCPCFLEADMYEEALLWDEYRICAVDVPFLFHPGQNWPGDMLITSVFAVNDAWGGQANLRLTKKSDQEVGAGYCRYIPPNGDTISIYYLNTNQVLACQGIIAATIWENDDRCLCLCVGEDCEGEC